MKGKELKFKRELVGLTAAELANRVGVTRQLIYLIESDDNYSSAPVLKVIDYEIAKAFIECKTLSLTNIKLDC